MIVITSKDLLMGLTFAGVIVITSLLPVDLKGAFLQSLIFFFVPPLTSSSPPELALGLLSRDNG